MIDDDNHPLEDALKSFSFRSGMARLEELGFKNIKIVKVLGDNDCIVKILANGKTVKKMQKVPVNAHIVVEVYDGRLTELRDSLQAEEYIQNRIDEIYNGDAGNYGSDESEGETAGRSGSPAETSGSGAGEESIEFF